MSNIPLSLDDLKRQAKALRGALEKTGQAISHSQSLELIARQHGCRDWNTLCAKAGNARVTTRGTNRPPVPFMVGQRVTGKYLGCRFEGEMIAVKGLGHHSRFEVMIRFDEAVNVSRFDSMTIFRRQVRATVGRSGTSAAKTSDGQPHMAIIL